MSPTNTSELALDSSLFTFPQIVGLYYDVELNLLSSICYCMCSEISLCN